MSFTPTLVRRVAFICFLLGALLATHASEAAAASTVNTQIQDLRAKAQAALDRGNVLTAYDLAARAAHLGVRALGILDPENLSTYLLVSDIAGRLGQPAMSIVFALNAYSIAEAKLPPESPLMGNVLRALGSAYGMTGDYETAEPMLQAAISLHEQALGNDSADVATDMVALVKLYLRSENRLTLANVPKLLKRAKSIRVKAFGDTSVEVAEVWRLYGEAIVATFADAAASGVLSRQKALDAGELALHNAETVLKMRNAPSYELSPIYRARGDLYTKAGRLDEAFDAYGLAVQTSGDVPSPQDALRFAMLAAKRNDVDLTVSACRAASAMSYSHFQEFARWSGIGEGMNYRLRASPAEQLCLSFINGLTVSSAKKARALLDIGIKWRAAAIRSERARYEMLRKPKDASIAEEIDQVNAEHRRLADALIHTIRTGEADLNRFEEISDDLRHHEEILALLTFSPQDSLGAPSASYDQLIRLLRPQSALLMFMKIAQFDAGAASLGPHARYIALVVTPDGKVTLKDYGDAQEFEARINGALSKFRSASYFDIAPQLASMTDLYELIWSRVAGVLASYTSIFVVAEGPISLVPLAALRDEEGRFLIEKNKKLIQLTSPVDVFERKAAHVSADRNALIVGYPEFGIGSTRGGETDPLTFEAMEGGKPEVEAVEAALNKPVIVRTAQGATKAETARLSRSRFVHFATHGFFLGDEAVSAARAVSRALVERGNDSIDQEIEMVRSGIALAGANAESADGGILTALEIAGMDFSATELVTLSACETGVGIVHNDEGIFGLRLAFQLAGAKSLIMSLWLVHSNELFRQMKILYRMLQLGESPSTALQKMQLQRIAWYRRYLPDAPPSIWAAFVVQGQSLSQGE